jgi:hypothetical protein
MLSPAHFAVGGAIGAAVRPRWLAPPVALASHYLLDAIPHFERLGTLADAFDIPPWTLIWAWQGPWVMAGAAILAWMVWQAARSGRWGWWGFVIACGVVAALPDVGKIALAPTHPANLVHEAMHTQSDWGFALHRWLVHHGEFFNPREIVTSPVAYIGFLAEIAVEVGLFWLGWRVVARFSAADDIEGQRHADGAGHTADSGE